MFQKPFMRIHGEEKLNGEQRNSEENFGSAKLPPDSNRCLRTHLDTALYVKKRVPNFTTPTTKTRVFSAPTPNFQQILFGKL